MNEQDDNFEKLAEAEDYFLQAEFILHSLQANLEVYGSNSVLSGATPANVELAIQYIDRSLEYFPDSPKYLNMKALFLGEGLGQKDKAIELLEKAHKIDPRDINVENNLKTFKTSKCFIATAAFGTPMAKEISILRHWRDRRLATSRWGRLLINIYNAASPPIARLISKNELLRGWIRSILKPIIAGIERRYDGPI